MRLVKEFEVETSTGKVCTVEIEAFCEYDNNYGADADGNRGTKVFFVTDQDPVGVTCEQALTRPETEEAEALALKESCKHDWEFEYLEADDSDEPEAAEG